MEIDGNPIGETETPYFIAEAGVNHNGDLELAKKLIDTAVEANADAVKFQTFDPEQLVSKNASTAGYQKQKTGAENQREMLQQYELDRSDHELLIEYCAHREITFLSTPFDPESADMLVDLEVPAIKLGSGELNNHPLIKHVVEYGVPLIISTGMGTLDEVHAVDELITSIDSEADVAFLHCTSAYPCEVSDVNLRAMETMDERLSRPVGFSDHTTLPEMPALAVTAGATIVEKHFTVDSSLPGPDHDASSEPAELTRAVDLVDKASLARGTPTKTPVEAEIANMEVARKSIHAAEELAEGTVLTPDKLTILRPASGISPDKYDEVVGKQTTKKIAAEDPITDEDIA